MPNAVVPAAVGSDKATGRYWGVVCTQAILTSIFLLSGIYKLDAGQYRTIMSLNVLNWLPESVNVAFARVLPFAEILLAGWIISGKWPRSATWTTIALLSCFTIILVFLGRAIGWQNECGRMGPFSKTSIITAIARNILFVCVGFVMIRMLGGHSLNKE